MNLAEKTLVAKATLKTNTYYLTSRKNVILDGNEYMNVVLQWGDVSKFGNIGNDQKQSDFVGGIVLNNGEQFKGSGYVFDPTDTWNNSKIEIRRWVDGAATFNELEAFASGKIKDFQIENNTIGFTIDSTDSRDKTLLPRFVCNDQSGIIDEYKKVDCYCRKFSDDYDDMSYIGPTKYYDDGELVLFRNNLGDEEYREVKYYNTVGSEVTYLVTPNFQNDYAVGYIHTAEKPFISIPKDFINKTIPMTYGDLTDIQNGEFGKSVTINSAIGEQKIIVDSSPSHTFETVGYWESGLERFFTALQESAIIAGNQKEYDTDQNVLRFSMDTTITLSANITDTSEGYTSITVSDYAYLMWVDEETGGYGITVNQKTISQNIISIGKELMLITEKPTSNDIVVERGYQNTEISQHSIGDKIYQSSKFGSKNLLIFTERFMCKYVTNSKLKKILGNGSDSDSYDWQNNIIENFHQSFQVGVVTHDGKYSYLEDVDTDNSANVTQVHKYDDPKLISNNYVVVYNYFDAVFNNIKDDFDTIGWYPASKNFISLTKNPNSDTNYWEIFSSFGLVDPNFTSNSDASNLTQTHSDPATWQMVDFVESYRTGLDGQSGSTAVNSDHYSSINRDFTTDDFSRNFETYVASGDYSYLPHSNRNLNLNTESGRTNINLSSLKDLNKKFKFYFMCATQNQGTGDPYSLQITNNTYNVGFWIDFFANFTEKTVMANITGRTIDLEVITICGDNPSTRLGDSLISPVDVLAHILTTELKYSSNPYAGQDSEFMDTWVDARDYSSTYANYAATIPAVIMSYGVDDAQKPGWEFCQELASHFLFQITKTEDSDLDFSETLIDIINLHEIYYNTPTGSAISTNDILFLEGSGQQRIKIQHTGSDLIYNDIQVKYRRNNSTGEYQDIYTLPTFATLNSGITLEQARTDFFGGDKSTLVIESPYIYGEQDAIRLAQWKADDQAEVHLWVDFFLDFDHYSEANSLTRQYKRGQVIYLTGDVAGVTFTSSRKFYIQNVYYRSSGQEVQIQAKSIDPITSF